MELYERIPNNVNLSEDKRLQRALEKWLPNYLEWWREMGPEGFQEKDVWLRTAVSVEPDGWAHFDYVRMPEYRWGIFLKPAEQDARVGFGDNMGLPAYQEVPGEFRNALRRIVVTQADTEPASVEQQRRLGQTCPSLYDLRNLFQVNVEDGRQVGGIPFDIIQRYINYWFSYSLDLFGGEISSNAADFFAAGLKGRYQEQKKYDEHVVREDVFRLPVVEDGRLVEREVPMRNALNEVLRGEYVRDCERALERWNKYIAEEGVSHQLRLPSTRFHRHVGEFAGHHFDVDGNLITAEQFEAGRAES